MVKVNPNFAKLDESYFFQKVGAEVKRFERESGKPVTRLHIGNTSQPLTSTVIDGLRRGVDNFSGSRFAFLVKKGQ